MIIDCEYKLTEIQAKELKTSLNYLVNNILSFLKKKEYNYYKNKFSIIFNNKNVFSIILIKNEFVQLSYINIYGEDNESISLQDALNINKYALDIENHILYDNLDSFEAYYTEQNIDKIIPIFTERNKKLRIIINNNDNKKNYIDIKNTIEDFMAEKNKIDYKDERQL